MNIQTITNVSDCVPLYLPHSLYLKPTARFNVSVSLPSNKLGKTISNLDIMEKLNSAIQPDKISVLKVSKSTLEFIRFEGELEDRSKLRNVLARLDGLALKMSSFTEPFKVRACEAKDDFPNRHDWDSFFRDARNMDEMKPGERPDTVHISNLPIRWFCPRHMENDDSVKPSENIFRRIFEKFGSVRCVDIPICDVYRSQMKTEITGMKTFTFDQEVMFEGYIQFSEYLGFVKAMDEFRGMKLVRKYGEKNQAVPISVTFDKTKHLTDASVKRRNIVRDRLIEKEKEKQEEELKKKKIEEEKLERERKRQEEQKQKELGLQREREERRKEKHLKKIREQEQLTLTHKIIAEERKLLIAQRKLESLRVLEALFERIKQKEPPKKHPEKERKAKELKTNDLRNKLVTKYKSVQQEVFNKQRSKVEQVKGKTGLLSLIDRQRSDRSPSVNTISSDDSVLSDSHLSQKARRKKAKSKKRDIESDPSISSSETESTKAKKEAQQPMNPFTALYNPGAAAEVLQQLSMYPYAAASVFPIMAAAAGMRPGFFPPTAAGGRRPYRGRFPMRGRGGRGRGRNDMYSYDDDQYVRYFKKTSGFKDGDYHGNGYYEEHDRRRSRSRSRTQSYSRSRSRSRSNHRYRTKSRRSRSRGRSRSRSRSNRSHSHHSSKSHSRNRSRRRSRSNRSRSKSKTKLVSTRRSRTVSSSSGWSRSRSKSKSRSRSWSRAADRDHSEKHDNSAQKKVVLQPEKLVRSAREIQRSVQQKLYARAKEEEEAAKKQSSVEDSAKNRTDEASTSKRRSTSVDSSKFISPKRKAKSTTPEKEWGS